MRKSESNTPHGNITHGLSRSRTYNIWKTMIQRCCNPKKESFKFYGARGIAVCDKWLTFDGFYEDMGLAPIGLSLERKNNDRGYTPDNCKWATRKEQANNTRGNVLVTYAGATKTISQMADTVGISRHMLSSRLRRGWSIERAVETPPMQQFRRYVGA